MKISDHTVAGFRTQLEGSVLLPGDAAYDESRTIWNGMFDKRPAIIARCLSAKDISHSITFARAHMLRIAVKGGGHNSAGTAVCDDGMMIDLSLMQKVEVDPKSGVTKVEGGCLLSTVDEAPQEHGLAVSAGIVSHTGVGGLALGGGFGWISRKYGLTIDNLLSVDLVTAEGKIVHASKKENPDLFWAVSGGGGNFGIVSTFQFQAVNVGTEVYSGPIVKRFEDLKSYIQFHREFVRTMPDEMTIWMVVRHAPPLPFIEEKYHGELVILVPYLWLGDEAEGEKLIQPLRDHGVNIGDASGMKPWTAWQSAFDGLVEHGARNYWKSHHLTDLSDECIDQIHTFAQTLPSAESEIFIPHMEGAPSRIAPEATAFPHRSTPFLMNIHTRWRDKEDDQSAIAWAKEFHDATRPFSQGVYVNFLSDEGKERVREAYTEKVWERLVEAKRKWDPKNVFNMNQNIAP
ncbi:MAG: FAD-binding oxidoreductase [Bacteroides sp.]|nr:FAD-binding oxidoreductase [Bacteroides sp.]